MVDGERSARISLVLITILLSTVPSASSTPSSIDTQDIERVATRLADLSRLLNRNENRRVASTVLEASRIRLLNALAAYKKNPNSVMQDILVDLLKETAIDLSAADTRLELYSQRLHADAISIQRLIGNTLSEAGIPLAIPTTPTSPQTPAAVKRDVVDWIRTISSTLLSWPFLVFIVLVYLARSSNAPGRVANLLRPFRAVKFLGAELLLGEEEAKRLAQNAEEFFEEHRKQGRREYDRLARMHQIREKLERVVREAVNRTLGDVPQLRATVHVPDFLFADTLYQLLDYYPTGGGGGRAWSIRFGIIGKAWRLGNSEIAGEVPTEPRMLIQEWGMTVEEATAAGRGRRCFAAILLRDPKDQDAVAILYMDSAKEKAFGETAEDQGPVIDAVVAKCVETGLISALVQLNEEVRARSPQIAIYGRYMSSS